MRKTILSAARKCLDYLWRFTQHMLTAQLRELESDGLVARMIYAEVPPRVEYSITEKARGLGPTMEALTAWWLEYGESVPPKSSGRGRKSNI
ncbi:hypothetical protein GF617_24690 [Lelliottia sp. RWM.1]|nr:hypothetical protein [Lelliottia sp. RWM.1]